MSFSIGINFFAFALGIIARDYGFPNMYSAVGIFLLAGCIIFTYKYFISAGRAKRLS